MSASLVGSEMCIRDRGALHAAREYAGFGSCAVVSWAVTRKRRAAAPSPVSYTHLTLPTICSV
eukprot:7115133-Alexandrium_andersonii.AAC.1